MWILTPLEDGAGETHKLHPGKSYVVGRKNCDILLANDQSISRAHATLTVTKESLTLTDSSKYGTFVNEERLSGSNPRKLNAGDRVTFGVFQSKFSVEKEGRPPVVCSSCLDNEGKASLAKALVPLGGKMVNSWTSDCTHLVMPAVKVTIKTICALLCCRPIVKHEFFTELGKAMKNKLPLPKPESFIPEVDEPSLNKEKLDLRERPERKQLFAFKNFLFLSEKQLKRLGQAVSFGGGRTQLLFEGTLPTKLIQSPGSCVIDVVTGNSQVLSPSTKKWADDIGKILRENGLRPILESEIGLATMYASCDRYCNPAMSDSGSQRLRPSIQSATLSQSMACSQSAVEETVMAAASQNITAYVANTEPSHSMSLNGIAEVGETPERNQGNARSGQTQPSSSQRYGDSPKVNQTTSPPKQTALTSFFQPVDKKRPREEDSSPMESEPKRTALFQTDKPTHGPTRTQSLQQGSGVDLFPGQSESDWASSSASLPGQSDSRKRKKEEEPKAVEELGMNIGDLESIMDEDMDDFDGKPSSAAVVPSQSSLEQSMPNKKQRIDPPSHRSSSQKSSLDPEEGPSTNGRHPFVKEEPVPFLIESQQNGDSHLANGDKENNHNPFIKIKQEPSELLEDELPKRLILVEFKDLTVAAPTRPAPNPQTTPSNGKNFKRFRKAAVPGSEGLPNIIGGSDLLAYNKGKSSELEEWLREATEVERQTKQDQSIGDDLFRYNPKPAKKK